MGFVAFNERTDEFALAQRTITLQPVVPIPTKYFFYFMMSSYFQVVVKKECYWCGSCRNEGGEIQKLTSAISESR